MAVIGSTEYTMIDGVATRLVYSSAPPLYPLAPPKFMGIYL